MKNQIELISYYTEQLKKVIESHGGDSDYSTHAFFTLQAAKLGLPIEGLNAWATTEMERLHQIALDRLNPVSSIMTIEKEFIYSQAISQFVILHRSQTEAFLHVLKRVENYQMDDGSLVIDAVKKPEFEHLSWNEIKDKIENDVKKQLENQLNI